MLLIFKNRHFICSLVNIKKLDDLNNSEVKSMQRIFPDKLRVNLNGYIYSEGKTYAGNVEYISNEGMEYTLCSSIKVSKDFTPPQIIQLSFLTPLGSPINLTCNVICFLRSESEDKTLTMGMKVLNPPPQYMEFIETLKPGDLVKKWK